MAVGSVEVEVPPPFHEFGAGSRSSVAIGRNCLEVGSRGSGALLKALPWKASFRLHQPFA